MNTLSAILSLLLMVVGPQGLDVSDEGVVYSPQRTFRIPLDLTPEERAGLAGIRLYVSDDEGKTWVRHSDGDPRMEYITFHAKQDGEFWFTITLVDRDGKQVPENVQAVEPGLRVSVDTLRPELTIRAIRNKAGRAGIRWVIEDPSLVPSSLRLAVMDAGQGHWRPYEIRHPEEKMLWFGEDEHFSKIQASVFDRAGNERVIELEVVGQQFTKRDVDGFALGRGPEENVQVASATEPEMDESHVQPVSHAVPENETTPEVTVCSSNQIVVNYVVDQAAGAAGARAELWVTSDHGETWSLAKVDDDGQSPVEARVATDGLWGLKILINEGRTPTAGPPSGTKPEILIEVDTMAPEVELPTPTVSNGQLIIRWKAEDRNFDNQPIDILYGTAPSGPWRPVANGLRNTGEYVWNISSAGAMNRLYFRIEARDRARHVGFAQTAQPINLGEGGSARLPYER